MYTNNLVIGLLGPTASGKTDLACKLAEIYPIDIISVDSSMIYKGLDIGTAKPSKGIQQLYPHKLIDIRVVTDIYSVGEFIKDVLHEIRQSLANNRLPLLVGGTMMYFNALQNGIAALPEANSVIRQEILKRSLRHGWVALHAELESFDKESFQRIKPTDHQRIQRAHEVYILTQRPLSSFKASTPEYEFKLELLGLMPEDRNELHVKIANRFKDMLSQGLIAEVEGFFNREDISLELPAMRSVGYRQVWEYLEGKASHTEMLEQAIYATRQLAKRQYTWLRNWEDIQILSEPYLIMEFVKKLTSRYELT